MFNTLESNWDQSARRGRAALASFTLQAFGLSLLLAIPLFTIQGPPKLQWSDQSQILVPPSAPPAPPTPRQAPGESSNMSGGRIQEPTRIPDTIATLNEHPIAASPNFSEVGVRGGTGDGRRGVIDSIGTAEAVAPPPAPPAPTHPLKVSYWAEGNLVFRVQPIYPPLARQARIQGTVELRAIISKTGTIENLTVVSGHPMLVKSALEAVRQWRYRPYLLNGDPIEVETSVTVNFLLSGN
jgi:protein TonB